MAKNKNKIEQTPGSAVPGCLGGRGAPIFCSPWQHLFIPLPKWACGAPGISCPHPKVWYWRRRVAWVEGASKNCAEDAERLSSGLLICARPLPGSPGHASLLHPSFPKNAAAKAQKSPPWVKRGSHSSEQRLGRKIHICCRFIVCRVRCSTDIFKTWAH